MVQPKNVIETRSLVGIPQYHQGDHDGLCSYYTGTMMLSALYPYLEPAFGRSTPRGSSFKIDDPLIAEYDGPMNKGVASTPKQKQHNILARWYYLGENLKPLAKTLNNVVYGAPFSTSFEYEQRGATDKTFRLITESIDNGLPIAFGWDTVDLGCHAVLIVGYWIGRKDKWFLLNDPSGSTEVSWSALKVMKESNFEIIWCTSHDGPRPDRRTRFDPKSVRSTEKNPLAKEVLVERWTPDREWLDMELMFNPTDS